MAKLDRAGHRLTTFDAWAKHEYARTGGFTALVILVRIGETTVTPVKSTFFHVIGDELNWVQVAGMLNGANVPWDGVVFGSATASTGKGPVIDLVARTELADLVRQVEEDRLVLNANHFFDRWGRRMKVEEVTTQ